MPLYDYRCERCGAFRAFRPMAESNRLQGCPHCGSLCERSLSAPFLGGESSGGWLTRPGGAAQPGGSWRTACGLACGVGCSHAH